MHEKKSENKSLLISTYKLEIVTDTCLNYSNTIQISILVYLCMHTCTNFKLICVCLHYHFMKMYLRTMILVLTMSTFRFGPANKLPVLVLESSIYDKTHNTSKRTVGQLKPLY